MMEVQAYNPGAHKLELEESQIQGWLLVSEFKANLGYMNSVSKKRGGGGSPKSKDFPVL